MKDRIKVICFDQGGTLLYRVPLKDAGKADYLRIMEIAGVDGDPIYFGNKLKKGDKKYKEWSLRTNIEASEEIIWTRWLLPGISPDKLKNHYDELTLLFSHSKGARVFRSDAEPTVAELYKRGYLIAVITNTVSLTLVPIELQTSGIWKYISAHSMSSVTSIRKPKPDMFLDISKQLNVKPENCVYIGDQPNRDVEGPRRAGFGLNVILKTSNYPEGKELSDLQIPAITVDNLIEFMDLFPQKEDL